MRLKLFPLAALVAALLLLWSSSAVAQMAPVSGKVTLKRADGTVVPVAGATVDIYRTDMKARYEVTTDKSGAFSKPLPYIGTYTLAVSAPGARADYRVGVRLGRQPVNDFALVPGDGARLALEQITAVAGTAAPPPAQSAGESAEINAKREELMRKNAEIEAANKKITEANEIISRTFSAGNAALTAAGVASRNKNPDEAIRNYTAAIAQYDEGLAADQEQPAILTNKAVALKGRGVERFNVAVTSKRLDDAGKTAALDTAKRDWKAAAESSRKAVTMLKAQTVPTDAAELARYNSNKYAAMLTYAESMRLFVSKAAGFDAPNQADAGVAAFKDYLAVESDPAKKSKAQVDMAQMLFDAGHAEKALVEFRAILREQPNNPEANLGAGLTLYAIGEKGKLQEVANYLQRFVDLAPDTHPNKDDAKIILSELKSSENITPVKPKTMRRSSP